MYTRPMAKSNSTSLYPKMEEMTTFDLRDLDVKARPELVESIPRQDVPGQRNERNDNHLGAPELEEVENLAVSHHVVDDADGAAVVAVCVDDDQYLSLTEGAYKRRETDFRQDGLDNCVNWKPAKEKDRAVGLTEEIKQEEIIRENIEDLKCCPMPEGVTERISNKLSDGLEKWNDFIVYLQGEDLETGKRFGKLCQLEAWTSKDVLRVFCLILNKDTPDCTTALDKDDLIDLLKKKETVLPRYINLILMLGRVGNKLIITDRTNSDQGRHFVFVHLDTKKKEAYYCDSLGLITPELLHEYLIDLIDFTKFREMKEIQIKLMHEPSSSKLNKRHVCSGSCRNYPLQTCNNVCGLVVMYCSALAALERDLFVRLFVENKDKTFLHYPTRYEGYLRRVLCTWFATDEIDLSLLKIEGVTESVPE